MMKAEPQTTELARILEITHAWSQRFQDGAGNLDPGPDEVSLFGAKGGCTVGREAVLRLSAAASRSLGGHGARPVYDVLASYIEGDMAFIAGREHVVQPAGGILTLRITHVYRRVDGVWTMVHRHADAYQESPFEGTGQ
jgi:hypothetical protein